MASYREVVDEIEGALAHKRRRQFELGAKLLLCCEGSAPQLLDTAFSPPEPNRPGNLAFRSLLSSHRRQPHDVHRTGGWQARSPVRASAHQRKQEVDFAP